MKLYSGFAYRCMSRREYLVNLAAAPAALLLGLAAGLLIGWWMR